MLVVARDLGRFPSEIMSVGCNHSEIELAAPGWLGKWLQFRGRIVDTRPPIMWSEVLEMLGLYLLEKEEQKDAEPREG